MVSDGEKKVYSVLYSYKEGLHVREICRLTKLTLPPVTKHIKRGEIEGKIVCEKKGQLKVCRLNFNNPKLISILQDIELSRLQKFPLTVQESTSSFINDLAEKPLIALIFGSFAKGKYTKSSDLDILLIFQRLDDKLTKNIESSAIKIRGRTGVNIQPVSLDYSEFEKKMLDKESEFMKDIRKEALILQGFSLYFKLLGRFLE